MREPINETALKRYRNILRTQHGENAEKILEKKVNYYLKQEENSELRPQQIEHELNAAKNYFALAALKKNTQEMMNASKIIKYATKYLQRPAKIIVNGEERLVKEKSFLDGIGRIADGNLTEENIQEMKAVIAEIKKIDMIPKRIKRKTISSKLSAMISLEELGGNWAAYNVLKPGDFDLTKEEIKEIQTIVGEAYAEKIFYHLTENSSDKIDEGNKEYLISEKNGFQTTYKY